MEGAFKRYLVDVAYISIHEYIYTCTYVHPYTPKPRSILCIRIHTLLTGFNDVFSFRFCFKVHVGVRIVAGMEAKTASSKLEERSTPWER